MASSPAIQGAPQKSAPKASRHDMVRDALVMLRAQNSAGWPYYARCAARLGVPDPLGHHASGALTILLFGLLSCGRTNDVELLLMGYPIAEVDRARALGRLLGQPSIQAICEVARGMRGVSTCMNRPSCTGGGTGDSSEGFSTHRPATHVLLELAVVLLVERLHKHSDRISGIEVPSAIRRTLEDIEEMAGVQGLGAFADAINLCSPLDDIRFHAWVDAHLFARS